MIRITFLAFITLISLILAAIACLMLFVEKALKLLIPRMFRTAEIDLKEKHERLMGSTDKQYSILTKALRDTETTTESTLRMFIRTIWYTVFFHCHGLLADLGLPLHWPADLLDRMCRHQVRMIFPIIGLTEEALEEEGTPGKPKKKNDDCPKTAEGTT